jgi:uncharacterized protein (TIGR04255 family)
MTSPQGRAPRVEDRRQYRNPPIREALCEIRFAAASGWDLTVPGLIYSQIRGSYPSKPVSASVLQAGVNAEGQDAEPGPTIVIRTDAPRVQFKSEDGLRIIAVGENVVSAHILAPYTAWEEFRQQIREAIDVYLATVQEAKVIRVGLRYINQIEIPTGIVELDDYFTSAPKPPPGLPQRLAAFITREEGIYEDAPVRLITTFATADAEDAKSRFTLDLDVVREWDDASVFGETDELISIIDDLRVRERQAFESLITDRSRELFDAD